MALKTLSASPFKDDHTKIIYYLARFGHLLPFTGPMAFFDRYEAYFVKEGIDWGHFNNGYNKLKKAGELKRKYQYVLHSMLYLRQTSNQLFWLYSDA
jgi:hypothetical protein